MYWYVNYNCTELPSKDPYDILTLNDILCSSTFNGMVLNEVPKQRREKQNGGKLIRKNLILLNPIC